MPQKCRFPFRGDVLYPATGVRLRVSYVAAQEQDDGYRTTDASKKGHEEPEEHAPGSV